MIHRIVITGAESTGKTTLARVLAAHYDEPCSHEFVREYVNNINRPLQKEDLQTIANGQFMEEDSKLEQARKLIIHDTNILSSIIYSEHYFQTQIEWVNERFDSYSYSLYLLCLPDIPWQADPGQREGPQDRQKLHDIFKAQLTARKLPHIEIGGLLLERKMQAIKSIDVLLES